MTKHSLQYSVNTKTTKLRNNNKNVSLMSFRSGDGRDGGEREFPIISFPFRKQIVSPVNNIEWVETKTIAIK